MTFAASWHNLLENAEELPPDATLLTPLSRKPFRITDVQEHRILIEYRKDQFGPKTTCGCAGVPIFL
jgi:hypothetical protein